MNNFIEMLKKVGELKVIEAPCNVDLEIGHAAYIEVKKENNKALLFKTPVKNGQKFGMPVLMNIFGNKKRTKMILGDHPDNLAKKIDNLLKPKKLQNFGDKISILSQMYQLKSIFPQNVKKGACQQVIKMGEEAKLSLLPILKTWEKDGGPFITMGQVYTKRLDGHTQNLGLYRLQMYDDHTLGMHWQIHKDATHYFWEYEKQGYAMPVSVAIGGDPLYTWCAQAPMPPDFFELMLYGFFRGKSAKLVKSLTNDIYVPADADIIIEGMVDPTQFKIEGPFGDHTGYYTLEEPYPVMQVQAITSKKDPVFLATVVGKPPAEDKYMGWGTERIFFPLLQKTTSGLVDYHMPENGVFHNLVLSKIETKYPGVSKQAMHSFWGVGQMSFVKHAIFIDEKGPTLTRYSVVAKYILDRLCKENILVSEGIVDALDHSANRALIGGKIGIDCTIKPLKSPKVKVLKDNLLFNQIKERLEEAIDLEQYCIYSRNPVCVISIHKKRPFITMCEALRDLKSHLAVVVFVDGVNNDLKNPYMLVWRATNNIDGKRDLYLGNFIALDATNKSLIDGYERQWPGDVECTKEVIAELKEKGIVDFDDELVQKFQL